MCVVGRRKKNYKTVQTRGQKAVFGYTSVAPAYKNQKTRRIRHTHTHWHRRATETEKEEMSSEHVSFFLKIIFLEFWTWVFFSFAEVEDKNVWIETVYNWPAKMKQFLLFGSPLNGLVSLGFPNRRGRLYQQIAHATKQKHHTLLLKFFFNLRKVLVGLDGEFFPLFFPFY